MRKSASTLKNVQLKVFLNSLAKAFLDSGEAKWWDAQVAAMASEVLTGLDLSGEGVCNRWERRKRTRVSLLWRSTLMSEEDKEPYGSVVDDADADAAEADFCVQGNNERMYEWYWAVINGTSLPTPSFPSRAFGGEIAAVYTFRCAESISILDKPFKAI